MSTDHLIREALEESVRDLPCPEPDLEALLSAGQALRIRRAGLAAGLAAVVVLMLVGVSLLWTAGAERAVDEPVPATSPTTRDDTAAAPTGPLYLNGGWAGVEPPDPGAGMTQFTRLAGGVVSVERDTNEPRVLWQSWQGETKVIGWNPWPTVEPFSSSREQGGGHGATRALRRDVVGNPLSDHVAWIEQASSHGDLVVVRASTGEVVARTAIPGEKVQWLDIRSIDDRMVHLRRCPAPIPQPREDFDGHPGTGPQTQDGCTYSVWEWPSTSALRDTGHSWVEPDGTVIHDMTTDVWAVQRRNSDALSFITPQGERLSDATLAVTPRNEGGGLSPDGRYWYSPGSATFVDTRTGELRPINDELVRVGLAQANRFVWTGATTITVAGPGRLTTCDAATTTCAEATILEFPDSPDGASPVTVVLPVQ